MADNDENLKSTQEVVDELPEQGTEGIIYLVKPLNFTAVENALRNLDYNIYEITNETITKISKVYQILNTMGSMSPIYQTLVEKPVYRTTYIYDVEINDVDDVANLGTLEWSKKIELYYDGTSEEFVPNQSNNEAL